MEKKTPEPPCHCEMGVGGGIDHDSDCRWLAWKKAGKVKQVDLDSPVNYNFAEVLKSVQNTPQPKNKPCKHIVDITPPIPLRVSSCRLCGRLWDVGPDPLMNERCPGKLLSDPVTTHTLTITGTVHAQQETCIDCGWIINYP